MSIELIIGLTSLILIVIFFFFRKAVPSDFFDRFNQYQKEFERNEEQKISLFRSEILNELKQNREELQNGLKNAVEGLEKKFSIIDTRLDTRIGELTQKVSSSLETNLKEGFNHFAKVQESLKSTELQLQHLNDVGRSINDLNTLLKLPHLRGGFGEMTLERLLSDFLPQDSFELQYRIVPSSKERVDAVIKYPNQILPIDSKFPRESVIGIFSNNPVEVEAAQKELMDVIKKLAREIREKYIHPEFGTTDMALLFIPSETIYFEILKNPSLYNELSKLKVFTVSPNTLAVTLQAIAISRNYYEMAKGVEKTISEIKNISLHFENFQKRFEEIGKKLNDALNSFNISSTHLSRFDSAVTKLLSGKEP